VKQGGDEFKSYPAAAPGVGQDTESGTIPKKQRQNSIHSVIDLDFPGRQDIASLHSALIQEDIERILAFICLFLQPNADKESPFLSIPFESKTSYYYVMITIWYILNSDINLSDASVGSLEMSCSLLGRMLPRDNHRFDMDETGETLLLKWYHYGSVFKLVDRKFLNKSWCGDDSNLGELSSKVRRLRRAAKMTLAAAISSKRPYLPSDEIVDRLAFLATELGLENKEQGAEIRSLASSRIRQRDFTTSINPGYLRKGQKGTTSAPWEIYSLCHHSRLVVANMDRGHAGAHDTNSTGDEAMEVQRGNLSLFLTTDASLIPCWERMSMISCQAWLHSEPTAVLASTLLDIYRKDMEASVGKSKREKRSHRPVLLRHTSNTDPRTTDRAINWSIFKPPRLYHPREFSRSLQETPRKFRVAKMKLIRVPNNMKHYLGGRTEVVGWTVERLSDIWPDAADISLLDIIAFDSDSESVTSSRVLGKLADTSEGREKEELRKALSQSVSLYWPSHVLPCSATEQVCKVGT
jgi:hypothetical protein